MEISQTKRYDRLAKEAQDCVRDLTNIVFRRWASPFVTAEGKIDFMDDLSAVYLDFGFSILDEAITDLRQSSARRPQIAEIRAACIARRTKASAPADGRSERTAAAAERWKDIRAHPEEYIPLEMVVRDGLELARLIREHREKGIPIDKAKEREWLEWRSEKTAQEWREMLRTGKANVPVSEPAFDAKLAAAGRDRDEMLPGMR